jgi:acyl-CoA synthetase (AMP-forming)/AMP-acid ligase II
MLVTEMMEKARTLYPKKYGVICGNRRFTYSQFGERVDRLSNALLDTGLKKGDTVAILHRNCHYFLEVYFATMQVGIVLCPLNYRLSPRELAFILNDNGAKALIAEVHFADRVAKTFPQVPHLKEVIWTGGEPTKGINGKGYEDLCASTSPFPPSGVSLKEEGVIQLYYTSGTTGRQKGVMLSHRNVYTHAMSTIAELHLTDEDVWIHAAPMFHLADAWATWAITWVGATHTFVKEFKAKEVLETIQKERVTISNMIPMMLNMLVNYPEVDTYDFSSLRAILSGGAPIAPEVVRKIMETFKCDYIQTYGMTETSPYLTMSILKDHLKQLPEEEQFKYKAATGRAVMGISLKVVDEKGAEVKHDGKEVGEIVVKGDAVTRGYWELPEETKKAIKGGWLYTGDLAVIDKEGYVNIVDRKKDMIVTGGENVYSTEVENILYMHPAVLEAAVVGVADEKWGEAVKAVVVLKKGYNATEEEIITFCKENIAHYKAPKSVDFMDELPKTGSGKIYKKGLRDHYWEDKGKKVS